MDKRYFSEKVVEWYKINKRSLPWREITDPYRIWLSEIILQQTRVQQGLPYYLKFTERFHTLNDLANAKEQEVLRLWQGLGYYTRARNLHRCAKEIIKNCKGIFPSSFEALKKLPGVGEYTAAAIASLAFKERVAVIDGNVFRVLSRIFGISEPVNSTEGKKIFSRLANELVCSQNPDLHNQAIMEFGALYCTPRNPKCNQCIFTKSCFAAKHSLQQQLPVKTKAKATRKRYFYYFVIKKGKSLLMKKRDQDDIWKGLYDFYLLEKNRSVKIDKLFEQDEVLKILKREDSRIRSSGNYKHVLSHQVIISKFVMIDNGALVVTNSKNLRYYTLKKISDLPKPVLISRFLEDYQFLE